MTGLEAMPIRKVYGKIAVQIVDELATATPATLASLLWGYASLRFLDETFVSFAEDEIKDRVGSFEPWDLAKVAWALAVLKCTKTFPVIVARLRTLELDPACAKAFVRSCAVASAVSPSSVSGMIFNRLLDQCGSDLSGLYPYLLVVPVDSAKLQKAKADNATKPKVPRKLLWKMQSDVMVRLKSLHGMGGAQEQCAVELGVVLDIALPQYHVALEVERPWQYIQHPTTPEGVVKDGLTIFWLKVLEKEGWKVAHVPFAAWPASMDSQTSFLRYRVPQTWLDARKKMSVDTSVAPTIDAADYDEL